STQYYGLDTNYEVVDSFKCGNGRITDSHELIVLPNKHALLLSYDPEIIDMRQYVDSTADSSALVFGVIIQEIDEAGDALFEWRNWDHLDRMPYTDAASDINLRQHVIDYIHANSIEKDFDGNIIFSARHLDAVTKVCWEDGPVKGKILWQFGGKHNMFTITNDTLFPSHQHDVRRLPNGHITLFDNGNLHTPPFSRAMEYQMDETNMTATVAWHYIHPS